jgi:hypothetical protein
MLLNFYHDLLTGKTAHWKDRDLRRSQGEGVRAGMGKGTDLTLQRLLEASALSQGQKLIVQPVLDLRQARLYFGYL